MHKNYRLRPWETALLAAVCVTLLTGVWAQGRQSALADKVVRLHVIAASDSAEDQRVKLEVRDALLAYLTPRLEAASGAQDAAAVIAAASGELQRIAETASGGSARVELGRETYPTREYETFSLPAGKFSEAQKYSNTTPGNSQNTSITGFQDFFNSTFLLYFMDHSQFILNSGQRAAR